MALIGLNRDELDLSQLPKDSFYDPKKDDKDDLSGVQIRATITFKITDANGTVIKEWTEPAHSLNSNFALIIQAMWGATSVNVGDTSGNSLTVNGASGGTMAVTAPSGNTSYGIVVGSGASAGSTPSPSAPYLKAQIPNGTGSGQLEYGAVSVSTASVSGQTTSFTITRSFTNVSGATINVTEIGIIAYLTGWAMVVSSAGTEASASSDYVLIAYDIPSSAIAVQNGQTLTITYTFSVTT
jgi:hypothetical protein